METFDIDDLKVFYEKRFDGGGTTFGFNAITKPIISDYIQEFAIQSDGKTRLRDCIGSDLSLTPNWNEMYCY